MFIMLYNFDSFSQKNFFTHFALFVIFIFSVAIYSPAIAQTESQDSKTSVSYSLSDYELIPVPAPIDMRITFSDMVRLNQTVWNRGQCTHATDINAIPDIHFALQTYRFTDHDGSVSEHQLNLPSFQIHSEIHPGLGQISGTPPDGFMKEQFYEWQQHGFSVSDLIFNTAATAIPAIFGINPLRNPYRQSPADFTNRNIKPMPRD
jgi:hypothetical protein